MRNLKTVIHHVQSNNQLMKRIIFILITVFLINKISFGQTSNDKIIFVVDSIPVLDDPEYGNDIVSADVADITVIKNRDTLKLLGYERFGGVTYLFTKEYRNRPDSLKQIPSSKQLKRKGDVFLFNGSLFTSSFIDYYYSGKKQGEGSFLNGKLNGHRKAFYQNGKISLESDYMDGFENGVRTIYYEDGSLKEKGLFTNGKEEGIWKTYYPNGQVDLQNNYKNGELYDSAIKYYSTGKIKEKVFIKNGKVIDDVSFVKINQLMAKSNESYKAGDIKAAIKYCSKAIELDSTYASAYFSRGTHKLNDFQFDEAIIDFDKALKFEPFMETALANRAFARIRKYEFGNSRTLLNNNEVTVLAQKDKVPVPTNEQEMICSDLQKAIFLGNKSKMITDAILEYCKAKSAGQ